MRQLREPIDSYRSPCTRPPRTTRIDRHTAYETPGSFWLGDAEIDDKKSVARRTRDRFAHTPRPLLVESRICWFARLIRPAAPVFHQVFSVGSEGAKRAGSYGAAADACSENAHDGQRYSPRSSTLNCFPHP
jgi:hypothetical protein